MSRKIILGTVLLLALNTGALGQSSGDLLQGGQVEGMTGGAGSQGVSGEGSDTGSVPPGWDGEIAAAFFADEGAGTLRAQDEVTASWKNLSSEQQGSVRDYCANADIAQTGSDGEGEGTVTTGSTEAQTQAGTADDDPTQPAVTRGPLIRLCGWIGEL